MSEMLEHALDYARRGWPVVPCDPSSGPRGKQPFVPRQRDAEGQPIPKTGGLYKATTDLQQVRAWWTKWPDALIGVRMGREAGVFAVDPDVPKKPGDADGHAAWQALLREHGPIRTHTHQTPSGGLHVLFRWREDRPVTNREGQLPAGINVRGEGGYIIAPPSCLSDGRSYRIADPLDFFRFASAPEWLYALIEGKSEDTRDAQQSAVPKRGANVLSYAKRLPNSRYGAAALKDECVGVARARRGSRNNALNRAAFNLGTLAGAGVLRDSEVRDALLEAADESGLLHEDGHEAVLATIQSGLAAGIGAPRVLPERAPRSGLKLMRPKGASEVTSPPLALDDDVITQDGVACIFTDRFDGELRYCHHTGAWFEWTGRHWRKEETDLALQFARALGREASEGLAPKDLKEARKISFASGVERFARGDRTFAVTSKAWDVDPYLLGTPGGTIDTRNGDLRSADPADGVTKLTAVAPAAVADCPLWLRFLEDATGGDHGLVRFLQQWCGYSLTGETREHALVFVYGSGGNGKSVFLNTTSRIMADYAATASMDTFTASNSDRHPTDLAMLRGARMVTASETEEGRAWAESRIKQMTGGDPVTARFMRQDFFTYQPEFKLTIVGNHKPVLRNVDEAARRRFNLVPFTRKPVNPDRELEQKLRAEWPGILRWMIDGCLDWQQNGLVRPEAVKAATAEYFDNQDLFGQWLEDECDSEVGNPYKSEATAALFESWSNYAASAGETPGSKKSFSEMMQRRGFEPDKASKGVRIFRGVRKRSSPFADRVAGGG